MKRRWVQRVEQLSEGVRLISIFASAVDSGTLDSTILPHSSEGSADGPRSVRCFNIQPTRPHGLYETNDTDRAKQIQRPNE